jgi:hypothetical protein
MRTASRPTLGLAVEEMGLLARWREALERTGCRCASGCSAWIPPTAQPELERWTHKRLPGPIQWLRAEDDLPPLFAQLGLDPSASLPIHALVDGSGALRCVRVGAIHEADYGSVRALLTRG